jgi:anti-anti-sigma factor
MKFTLDKQDSYSVLSLDEENLNSLIAPDLKSEFVFLRNEGVRNLIFDLSQVKYVDSSGLSAILTANRLWKDYGSYVITGITHPSVEKLIKISRLDTILAIVPTVTESIDYVTMEDAERQLNTTSTAGRRVIPFLFLQNLNFGEWLISLSPLLVRVLQCLCTGAILLPRLFNMVKSYFLIDCGEGTQFRFKEAGIKPFRIQIIFISHLHGDHVFRIAWFIEFV